MLHVASEGDRAEGETVIREWAADYGLGDAEIVVHTGDVEAAIEREAADHTMVIVGATREGLLSGSLVLDVIEDVEVPVVLAEPHGRFANGSWAGARSDGSPRPERYTKGRSDKGPSREPDVGEQNAVDADGNAGGERTVRSLRRRVPQ